MLAKALIVGGLTIAAGAAVVPMVSASGSSAVSFGCYSTWGSTGSNAHCTAPSATYSGNYRNWAWCNTVEGALTSKWQWFNAGQYVPGFGQVNCTFSIHDAFPELQ
jgi:hypothetical protein